MRKTRAIIPSDISALKKVLDSCGLFPSEYLEDMIHDYFENPDSQDYWFCTTIDNTPHSIAFCAPEKFTEGTYNLYAIGVTKELQDKGIGSDMMHFLEDVLREKSARILIVETSGTSDFSLTREFYDKLNYSHEATVRDFWSKGDDKVIFWKDLSK